MLRYTESISLFMCLVCFFSKMFFRQIHFWKIEISRIYNECIQDFPNAIYIRECILNSSEIGSIFKHTHTHKIRSTGNKNCYANLVWWNDFPDWTSSRHEIQFSFRTTKPIMCILLAHIDFNWICIKFAKVSCSPLVSAHSSILSWFACLYLAVNGNVYAFG